MRFLGGVVGCWLGAFGTRWVLVLGQAGCSDLACWTRKAPTSLDASRFVARMPFSFSGSRERLAESLKSLRGSSNGRTPDSGSDYLGSNPSPRARTDPIV